MKIIFGILIFVFVAAILYMKFSCKGLWGYVPSKTPTNLVDSNNSYYTCRYMGFKNLFKNKESQSIVKTKF